MVATPPLSGDTKGSPTGRPADRALQETTVSNVRAIESMDRGRTLAAPEAPRTGHVREPSGLRRP